VWKLKRKATSDEEARIKRLEERLDAAVAESQRMRREMEALQRLDHRARPVKEARRHRPANDMDYNPDDTVN